MLALITTVAITEGRRGITLISTVVPGLALGMIRRPPPGIVHPGRASFRSNRENIKTKKTFKARLPCRYVDTHVSKDVSTSLFIVDKENRRVFVTAGLKKRL